MNKATRIDYLDIAKGTGIISVVWAHANGPFSSYIGLFHMPLFFLISGYLHNSKKPFRIFFRQKFVSLYLPFVLCNGIAFLIRAIISPNHIEDNIRQGLLILLTLNKDNQFFGPTWFLGALFIISIFHKLIEHHITDCSYKPFFISAFICSLAIIGFEIDFPYTLSRTFVLGLFYEIGYLIKHNQKEVANFNQPFMAIISFLLFIVLGPYNKVSMSSNTYKYYFTFIFCALCASYSVIYVSQICDKLVSSYKHLHIIKSIFCYLGRNSLDIVIGQFIAFRFIIMLQLFLDHIPLNQTLSFYPIYKAENGAWIAYTIAGLIVPILCGKLLRSLFSMFKSIAKCY